MFSCCKVRYKFSCLVSRKRGFSQTPHHSLWHKAQFLSYQNYAATLGKSLHGDLQGNMEERAGPFRGVRIHKGIPKPCQRDSCVEYVNGGARRACTAQALCTAFRHAIGRYLWSLTGGFSPGGVHRYRGDNVERDVYGGVWMTHPVIARVSAWPMRISTN
jgi:hypothetical protein